MKMSIYSLIAVLSVGTAVGSVALAKGKHEHGNGPCKQIVQACESAGFKKGGAKNGDGLWHDCVDPIVQGKTTVPGATKALPSVDASLVSACKEKHPKFGSGKVGSAHEKKSGA